MELFGEIVTVFFELTDIYRLLELHLSEFLIRVLLTALLFVNITSIPKAFNILGMLLNFTVGQQ